MQDEITVRPLVDILSEQLGEPVVMSGDNYVYLTTKEQVMQSEVDAAIESRGAELESQRIAEIKAEAGRIILKRYPEYKQRNATLGIYSQAYVDEMTAFIADIKNQSDALELDSSKTKNDFVL